MDLGSIFLILALLLLVGLFISRPLIEKDSEKNPVERTSAARPEDPTDHERSSLLAERDRLLNALQELEFDYTLGKIPAEDYPVQRKMLLEQGAGVLRRLDELQAAVVGSTAIEPVEERLEAVIAARRLDSAVKTAGTGGSGNGRKHALALAEPDDQLEVLLANRRRERREKAAGFCPRCGTPVQKSDRFCPKCGARI